MDEDLQARIQREITKLRGAYPQTSTCHATLEEWPEGTVSRHALQLDIRWPQHQSLISGPARDSADEALRAAFDAARRQLASIASREARRERLAA